jgi:hypothetical protein
MIGHTSMPHENINASSPTHHLASEVTAALVEAGAISPAHREALLGKLTAGGVKQEDWNLWIDIATSPAPEQEGEDANG